MTTAALESNSITATELKKRIDEGERLMLLDVRSISEYNAGHVQGAFSMPMDEAESRIGDYSNGSPVVFICEMGDRAKMTCDLVKSKLKEALVLEGGTEAWDKQNLPIIRTQRSRWSLERQVRLMAGVMAGSGAILAILVNPYWSILPALIGIGLSYAALTGT